MRGFDAMQHNQYHDDSNFFIASNNALPDLVDWRIENCLNVVQDQGQCGSCYAFSAVCAIEAHHALKTGHLLKLSGK